MKLKLNVCILFYLLNKKILGQFFESCLSANNEDKLIKEIITLYSYKIKSLDPAANILYFYNLL